jgi:hypothetical protein
MSKSNSTDTNFYANILGEITNNSPNSNNNTFNDISSASENNITIINNNRILNNEIFISDDILESDEDDDDDYMDYNNYKKYNNDIEYENYEKDNENQNMEEEDLYGSDNFKFLDSYDPLINRYSKEQDLCEEVDCNKEREIESDLNNNYEKSKYNINNSSNNIRNNFKPNLFQYNNFNINNIQDYQKNKNDTKTYNNNNIKKFNDINKLNKKNEKGKILKIKSLKEKKKKSDLIINEINKIDKEILNCLAPIPISKIASILIYKIDVSNLIKYLNLDKNKELKIDFFNENLFGKLISRKSEASNFHKKIEEGKKIYNSLLFIYIYL